MSSLLRPFVLESCQTTLRGRRHSSHRILTAPSLPTLPDLISSDSAVLDEPPYPSPPVLSPLRDAHVSDYFTSTVIGRHHDSLFTPISSTVESSSISVPQSPICSLDNPGSSISNCASSGLVIERLNWRLSSGYFAYFLCGWGDGVTGTVLPYFTSDFHLNTMTSSLLFTGSTCGFFVGTLLIEPVMNFLGRCPAKRSTSLIPYTPCFSRLRHEKSNDLRHSASQARHLVLFLASVLHAGFFIIVGVRGGYSATFIAYALAAFARAFLTATLNEYYALGPQESLGYSFGLWSLGGVLSPIVCQAIISGGVPWPHFYFGSLVLSGINIVLLYLTFRPTARENAAELRESKAEISKVLSPPSSPAIDEKCPPNTVPAAPRRSNNLRFALSLFYLWAFSIFSLLYCGSETATQGFMVTYLLDTREANPKTVGYVTSGFWGGITIGRFAWGYFVPRLSFSGRKFIILGFVALVMHVLIWVIDSTTQNAISASVIGALYGPTFPAILRLANDILPPETHMIAMGLISAFASLGAALIPFIAGVVSSIKGMQTLTYLTVPLGVVLISLWSLFPTHLPTRSSVG